MNDDGENLIAEATGAAEEIFDPLDGLVERSGSDPGTAFTPEVLERLAALKKEDRAAFELLRAQLKKAGCRVTARDEAIADEAGDVGGRGPTRADILIELADAAELSMRPMGPDTSILTSTAIARRGQSARRDSAAGWRGALQDNRWGAEF